MGMLGDAFDLTGTLHVPVFHWFWMLTALALGVWIGWRTAGERGAGPQDAP